MRDRINWADRYPFPGMAAFGEQAFLLFWTCGDYSDNWGCI